MLLPTDGKPTRPMRESPTFVTSKPSPLPAPAALLGSKISLLSLASLACVDELREEEHQKASPRLQPAEVTRRRLVLLCFRHLVLDAFNLVHSVARARVSEDRERRRPWRVTGNLLPAGRTSNRTGSVMRSVRAAGRLSSPTQVEAAFSSVSFKRQNAHGRHRCCSTSKTVDTKGFLFR